MEVRGTIPFPSIQKHGSKIFRQNVNSLLFQDQEVGLNMAKERFVEIDILRGTAMLFVLFAHCTTVVFRFDNSAAVIVLNKIFMIASPTFILISGIVMGFRFSQRKDEFMTERFYMIDRGIFMLSVVHILILITHYFLFAGSMDGFKWVLITDSVGVAVIFSALFLPDLTIKTRISLGIALYTISWMIVPVHVRFSGLDILKEILFGSTDIKPMVYGFYIVPWLSFFLIGTCFGERIGLLLVVKNWGAIIRFLLMTGIIFISVAALIKLPHFFAKTMDLPVSHIGFFSLITSPYQKYPPSPVYFLFFGGIALTLLSGIFIFRDSIAMKVYGKFIVVFGRNSLFVFILQYYIYYQLYHSSTQSYNPYLDLF